MKTKKYFLLVISFLLIFSLFYSSTNSISSVSDTATDKKNDYAFTQLVADLEQETSSTPQLSQTFAWDDNGTVICNEDTQGQSEPQICYDGNGGAIITWQDNRNGVTNTDIYAQKIDSAGVTQWADNGTVICNEDTQGQYEPQICCDGAGGAIITWYDCRSGAHEDIYAQKINSAGVTQWGDDTMWGAVQDRNGTVICNEDGTQEYRQICCDGAGGAIITWDDYRSGTADIYAQKIDSAGVTQWAVNGTVICNATQDQEYPQICCDGAAGGAIITWEDWRSGADYDIYAQKIDSAGVTQWAVNGTVICNATLRQFDPQICCDGAGGAIITWQDEISGADYDIYAQKIDSAGVTQWAVNGTVICNATRDQEDTQICYDGAGGAIITWEDYRSGADDDIYAQKIDSAGVTQWGNGTMWGALQDRNGTVICNATQNQKDPQICCDGAVGAIITWEDKRSVSDYDIYAQKIDSAGVTQWADNGTVICNATQNQHDPQICCDGAGGAIITWQDFRNGNNWDIYAQKIKTVSERPGLGLPSADDDDDDDDDDDEIIPGYPIIFLIGIMGLMVLYLRKRFQKRLKSVK